MQSISDGAADRAEIRNLIQPYIECIDSDLCKGVRQEFGNKLTEMNEQFDRIMTDKENKYQIQKQKYDSLMNEMLKNAEDLEHIQNTLKEEKQNYKVLYEQSINEYNKIKHE